MDLSKLPHIEPTEEELTKQPNVDKLVEYFVKSGVKNFHVSWGPKAHLMSADERAKMIYDSLMRVSEEQKHVCQIPQEQLKHVIEDLQKGRDFFRHPLIDRMAMSIEDLEWTNYVSGKFSSALMLLTQYLDRVVHLDENGQPINKEV